MSPNTNAATTAASGRLSRVTSASPRTAAGKAGKKAQRLPSPSLNRRCGYPCWAIMRYQRPSKMLPMVGTGLSVRLKPAYTKAAASTTARDTR